MHKYRFALLLALSTACGTPLGVSSTEPVRSSEADQPSATQDEPRRPLKAKVTTGGDLARALNIHHDFLYASNNACARRQIECREDLGANISVSSCEVVLAMEWCRTNDCQRQFLEPPVWKDPCITELRDRACNDLDRPLQCDALQRAGLQLQPNAWPEGQVEDPYRTFLKDL